MSSLRNRLAVAALVAAGLGVGAPPAPDRRIAVTANAPKRRATDWLGRPIQARTRVPFSSDRQHARAARLYMTTNRAGFEIMQQTPGAKRQAKLAARIVRAQSRTDRRVA